MHHLTLRAFCQGIGVAEDVMHASEAPRAFSLDITVPAGSFSRLTVDDLETLVESFGASLTLRVSQELGGPPLLEIDEGQPGKPHAAALAAIGGRPPDSELYLLLVVDKQALVEGLGLLGRPYDAHYFLFTAALAQWLGAPLAQLDGELYTSAHRPVVVVVSEPGVLVRGPFLNIASRDRLAVVEAEPPDPRKGQKEAVDQYLALAGDHLNWRNLDLSLLTPYHLITRASTPLPHALEGPLVDNLLHLAVIYTATRISAEHGQMAATYASAERPVALNLERGVRVPRYTDLLPRLALWPLGEATREKLSILRSVIVRELQDVPPAGAYERFIGRLKEILKQADWHLRVYLDGQLDKHFEQVEKATEFVTGAGKEVSGAVDGLVRALTESLLGAVGLIAITILATIPKDTLDSDLVRLALKGYAAYLVIFQLLYRMGSTLYSYFLLRGETTRRQAAYKAVLLEKADELFEPLEKRSVQFWILFALTAVLFAVVAVLLWCAADHLPEVLRGIM